MSSTAIEARSLSTLTALASNPPAYPRNPTHVRNEPLVLYIARVPGSKGTAVVHLHRVSSNRSPDVFLSPMKPRQKVVTAEDITSSLYFLHVEQPEDANLVAAPQFQEPNYQEERNATTNMPSAPVVQRKAVPGATGPPARKPVSSTLTPIDNFGSRQNMSAGDYSQKAGMLAPDSNMRRSFDSTLYQRENHRPVYPTNPSFERSRPTGTSLTLIRRDPASGAQWNVARIEDPSIVDVSSLNEPGSKKKIGAPMYIDVTNPGYSKFLQTENSRATPQPQYCTPQPEDQTIDSQNIFRRRLWMEGSQYTNGGFGHRKNSSYDFSTGRPGSRGSYDARTDRPSFENRPAPPPPFLTHNDQSYSTIQVSDRQTSFRGYVFTSPWNGRCEFITGGGGGSLKVSIIIEQLLFAVTHQSIVSPYYSRAARCATSSYAHQ
jgi:hypothetical protein